VLKYFDRGGQANWLLFVRLMRIARVTTFDASTAQRSTSSFSFSAFETRSLPALTRSYPRRFTFYVAHPNRSIQLSAFA
jgi:hypothetical protein